MILEEVCIRHHGAGIIYKEGEGKGVKDGGGVTDYQKRLFENIYRNIVFFSFVLENKKDSILLEHGVPSLLPSFF